jgi:4-alpha-glucanotransferase
MASGRFDVNRLDHFIAFVRIFEVPAQAKTAVNGLYQPGAGAPFFEAVRDALGALPFIADDLGATTPEVVALLNRLQIPGTRVLQFELGSDIEANSVPQDHHPMESVVYTGTHDNDTTAGWYQHLPSEQRITLQRMLGATDHEVVWAIIRKALASPADIAIVPAQDILELGPEARMNFPGIGQGNWRWRLKDGELSQELAQKLRSMTFACGRLRDSNSRPVSRDQQDSLAPRIAKRAYELYELRGCQNDQSVQDWLDAEREISIEAKR